MIPDSQSIMLPYLKLISDRKEWNFHDIIDRLGQKFKVSYEERQEMIPSGQKIFDYRVGYSRTIFKRLGYIESTRHAHVRITNKGLEFLSKPDLGGIILQEKKNKHNLAMETTKLKKIDLPKLGKMQNISHVTFKQALDSFLTYYRLDLDFINNFQLFKNGSIDSNDYIINLPGTFKAFLNEFKIARCLEKTKTSQLLILTSRWISGQNPDNVDSFAKYLAVNNLTHGKIMTSLASKILFLNNPWHITPLDSRVKKALGLQHNIYSEYLPLFHDFITQNQAEIKYYLDIARPQLEITEQSLKTKLGDLEQIRKNRFVDKILWIKGKV